MGVSTSRVSLATSSLSTSHCSLSVFLSRCALMGQGDVTTAVDVFSKVVLVAPGCFQAFGNLGVCYHMLGQNEIAIDWFKVRRFERELDEGPGKGRIKIQAGGIQGRTDMQKLRSESYVWDFGWEIAHAAVSRRPLVPLSRIVARTRMYTNAAIDWDLSTVRGPFSVAPCPTPIIRFTTCLYGAGRWWDGTGC
jgi:hypothetical protein